MEPKPISSSMPAFLTESVVKTPLDKVQEVQLALQHKLSHSNEQLTLIVPP